MLSGNWDATDTEMRNSFAIKIVTRHSWHTQHENFSRELWNFSIMSKIFNSGYKTAGASYT